MKQKRTYVTLLLVVALLALGIAYAAINNVDLTISGTAEAAVVAERTLEVVFTEATPGSDKVTANFEGITAEFGVTGLTTKGQTATATYKVKNNAQDLKAVLSGQPAVEVTKAGWYTFTASYEENFDGVLNPNEEVVVTVTATLNQTPQDADDVTAAAATATITVPATVGDSVTE